LFAFLVLGHGRRQPIREVSIHDEELATRRLSMMRMDEHGDGPGVALEALR